MKTGTKGSDLIVEGSTGVTLGTTGQHVTENVGGTSGGKSVVTGTSSHVDTNGGSLGVGLLGGDANAIIESSHLY